MKRLFAIALLALTSVAFGATTVPVPLLNPAGSTSGQTIISGGPSATPAWGNISFSSITGVVPIANGGTGSTSASAARTALGLGTAATANTGTTGASVPLLNAANTWSLAQTFSGATFTGLSGVSYPTAIFYVDDSTGAGTAIYQIRKSGATVWSAYNASSTNQFAIGRYVSGTFTDNPITISNSTGVVTMSDGIVGTPIGATSPSSGSFTTLAASGSITPSQTAGIVGTTTNNTASAGSVGEYVCAQVTNGGSPTGCATNTGTPVTLTTATAANITSVSLTAGDWNVCGSIGFAPAGTTTTTQQAGGINTTSAALPTSPGGGSYFFSATNASAGVATNTYSVGCSRQLLASTTTVFLVAYASFATSTQTAYGFLWAQRRR